MRLFTCLILVFFTTSCVTKYKGQYLSVFTVNSKAKNSKILNRFPDYGDGHRDGCIVLPEMRVDLQIKKPGIVSGFVSDVVTKAPLSAASFTVLTKSGKVLILSSDTEGKFTLNIDERVSRLEVRQLGYRDFHVEM